jgi:hypothetical protein
MTRWKMCQFCTSATLMLAVLSTGVSAADRVPGLSGVWLDMHLEMPFLIVRQATIQVAGCKFRHYEVLRSENFPSPNGETGRTYYVKATQPILGTAPAPIRDLDCAYETPMFFKLSVDSVKHPGLLSYNDCRSLADLESLVAGRDVACSSLMLERHPFP